MANIIYFKWVNWIQYERNKACSRFSINYRGLVLVFWHTFDHNFDSFTASSNIKCFICLFKWVSMSYQWFYINLTWKKLKAWPWELIRGLDQRRSVGLTRWNHVDSSGPSVAVSEYTTNINFTNSCVNNWQISHFFSKTNQ